MARGRDVGARQGQRQDALPLPVDVGEALVAYLRSPPGEVSARVVLAADRAVRAAEQSAGPMIVQERVRARRDPARSERTSLRHTAATGMLARRRVVGGDRAGAAPPQTADDRDLRPRRPRAAQDARAPWPGGDGMTRCSEALADYLRVRRQLGVRSLRRASGCSCSSSTFSSRPGAERITSELAVAWAMLPAPRAPDRWASRLGMVRGFAQLSGHDRSGQRDPVGRSAPGHASRASRHTSYSTRRSPR